MSTAKTSAVKERPILFSAPMIRALLDGRKTQTRRVVKPQPKADWLGYIATDGGAIQCGPDYPDGDDDFVRCPYGVPGNRLWVRETFNALIDPGARACDVKRKVWNRKEQETEYWVVDYQADGPHTRIMDQTGQRRWQPSIHMPRWASRITLEITGVRVEQLQSIGWRDVKAEGVDISDIPARGWNRDVDCRHRFRELWESIHGTGAWELNPWLWVISFRRVTN